MFRTGDRVVRTRDSWSNKMKKGMEFTVHKVKQGGGLQLSGETGEPDWFGFDPKYYKLVSRKPFNKKDWL